MRHKNILAKQDNEFIELNQDWQTRLSLIKDYIENIRSQDEWEFNGSIGIFELPLFVVEALLDQKFIDLEEKQPDGLSTREIVNFMRKWQKFNPKAVGYAVSHFRIDYRITLTGVIIRTIPQILITQRLKDAFRETFSHLTYCEITKDKLYSDQD